MGIGFFLKIWMVAAMTGIFAAAVVIIVDDVIVHKSTEIGYGQMRNFHIAMYLGENDTKENDSNAIKYLIRYVSSFMFFIEVIFYAVLLYLYAMALRQNESESDEDERTELNIISKRSEAAKGIILITIRSIVFLVLLVGIVLDLEIKYLTSINIMNEMCCLFLMFRGNQRLYDSLCGRVCGNCCIQTIYGSNYQPVGIGDNENEDLIEDGI